MGKLMRLLAVVLSLGGMIGMSACDTTAPSVEHANQVKDTGQEGLRQVTIKFDVDRSSYEERESTMFSIVEYLQSEGYDAKLESLASNTIIVDKEVKSLPKDRWPLVKKATYYLYIFGYGGTMYMNEL